MFSVRPPNSDMDNRIFNVHTYVRSVISFCMRIHTGVGSGDGGDGGGGGGEWVIITVSD